MLTIIEEICKIINSDTIKYLGKKGEKLPLKDTETLHKIITLRNFLETNEDVIISAGGNLDKYINDGPLYHGTTDYWYRESDIGTAMYIPDYSIYGIGVFGNGLYTTPIQDAARLYGSNTCLPFFLSGIGCSNTCVILKIGFTDIDTMKGIFMKEKIKYTNDNEWNELIKDKDFIINNTHNSEIIFTSNAKNKVILKQIIPFNIDIFDDPIRCNIPYNTYPGTPEPTDAKVILTSEEDCIKNKTPCPSTCNLLKSKKGNNNFTQIPDHVNCHN